MAEKLTPKQERMADDTAKKLPAHKDKSLQFKSGQSGNPAGRPKGARSKMGEQFLEALQQDFETNGVKAIVAVRTDKPDAYIKVIASLLPKELNVNVNKYEDMTDEQLVQRLKVLQNTIAPFLADADDRSGGDTRLTPVKTRH